MAVRISQYTPPGVYIQEEVVQPIPAFVGLPRQIVLIGEGDHCKSISNEAHFRAFQVAEQVTVSPSTQQFTLKFASDQKASSMTLFKNGDAQVSDSFSIVNATTIQVGSLFYDPTAVYTFSYQALVGATAIDKLAFDITGNCGRIDRVGSFPGTKDFQKGIDYNLVVSGVTGIGWISPGPAIMTGGQMATFSGLVNSGVSTVAGDTFAVTVNGTTEAVTTFKVSDFANRDLATAAEVAAVINNTTRGIPGVVASVSGNKVVLTTTASGSASTIQIGNGSSNAILGFTFGQIATGTGKNPAQGAQYFVS